MAKITTVIDIGSNSVRMAIFKKTSRFGFSLLYELKSRVRISEGCYELGGFLQERPMQRAISALKEFKKISQAYKSRKIFCIATSALRDAPNSKDFIKKVDRECGVKVKIIDGKREAFFGAVACANLSHSRDGIMVDIGGGSTECALIENGRIKDMISLNLGTIRLKELFFDKKLDLKEAKNFIQDAFKALPDSFVHSNIFGVGGTIRALAKLIMKHTDYPFDLIHGFEIDVKKYADLMAKVIKSKEDKLEEMGIAEERMDNIQGGFLILSMLIEHFKTKNITTCGVGIREGVFLVDLLRTHHYVIPNDINPSLQYLRDTFSFRQENKNLKKIILRLFDLLSFDFKLKDNDKRLLLIAGLMVHIGSYIDFYHENKHSAYLVKYALSYGFSHFERIFISLLIAFSEKKNPKDSDLQDYKIYAFDICTLQILSYILSIAKILGNFYNNSIDFFYQQKQLVISGISDNFIIVEKISRLARPKNLSVVFGE